MGQGTIPSIISALKPWNQPPMALTASTRVAQPGGKKPKHNPKTRKQKHPLKKYDPNTTPLTAFAVAREGGGGNEISAALGITRNTYCTWREQFEEFDNAVLEGYRHFESEGTLQSYIYNRLPDDLQELWDDLEVVNRQSKRARAANTRQRIEALLERKSKIARQHLFLYALTTMSFSVSEACRMVNVTMAMVNNWKEDPQFHALLKEIDFHKKNFFESTLIQACAKGEVAAIIFANKTINRDRGYNDKLDVNVTGQVNTEYTVSLEALNSLPIDARKQLLLAIREKKKEQEALEDNTIDGIVL